MANPLDLSQRRILVTGAGSGIGRAVAVMIGRMGGRVLLVDRDEIGMATTLGLLENGTHETHACDLRDVASIPGWMVAAAQASGSFAGLVHAAGIPCIAPIRLLAPDTYRDVMSVNLEAALGLARGFQRAKVSAGGDTSIVFISSVMGIVGSAGAVGYSISKSALIGMTRSMAVELAPRKIRVNCVAPGFVRTPMLDKVGGMWDAAQAAAVEALHPLGLGEPEDVASAVTFLLAPTARWITGTTLTIDGGYTAQ